MKTLDQQKADIQYFKALCKDISSLKLEDLTRPSLGEINFEAGQLLFASMLDFFSKAAVVEWTGVSLSKLLDTALAFNEPLKSHLDNLASVINAIRKFSVRVGNPENNRNQLLDNLDRYFAAVQASLAGPLAYEVAIAALKSAQSSKHMAEVEKTAADAKALIDGVKAKLNQDQSQISDVLQSVRSAAKEIGVTQEAIHFDKLAKNYLKGSIVWLLVAVGFGIATFEYAYNNLPQVEATNMTDLVKHMIPRVIIITLLLTGLFFCLRNFAALIHNQIVNRHRQTALTTFKTFVTSTEDPQIRNAILLQATRAIFNPQPSGYLKGEMDSPQINQFTEVIRSVAESTQKAN